MSEHNGPGYLEMENFDKHHGSPRMMLQSNNTENMAA